MLSSVAVIFLQTTFHFVYVCFGLLSVKKVKSDPVHTIKACGASIDIAPFILNLYCREVRQHGSF